MNVLSLFSGIGGLDLGLQRAGMTIAGQVEIDPWCRKVLAKHWPEVPRHDDVRTCAEWWGDRTAPDLVCGGFPCQPVTSGGKRLAQQDDRWLWPAFAEVLGHLQPQYALVENVPGLLGRGMGDVLGDLATLGFDAEWESLPAAAFGAPHIRDRVFIVGYRPSETPRWARSERGLLADAAGGGKRSDQDEPRRSPQRQDGADALRSGPALADATLAERRVSGWWATEPGVGRVAHGIPRRVDRLRGLGNAVVPQVAEHIGRMIMEAA